MADDDAGNDDVAIATTAPTLHLRSKAGDSHLTFTLVERLGGDGELLVEVASEGFTARQNVWFEAYELSRFVTELERYAKSAKGSVNLRSMSPEKFTVDFLPFSNKKVVLLAVRMQRHGFWGEPRFAQSLFVAFEWDPVGIPPLVEDLRRLLAGLA